MSFNDSEIPIPTPEAVPAPLNIGHLPASVLQSQTVEYLLQQNQDLMTRLQITIRRLTDLERQNNEINDRYKTSREQGEYFSNETNLLRDRNRRHELNLQHARSEIAQLEKRIAELYTSTKDYREKLEQENFQLRSDLAHLQRYRRRIQKSVRPMVQDLRERAEHYQERAFAVERELKTVTAAVIRLVQYRRRIRRFVRPMVDSFKFNLKEAERQLIELAAERSELKTRLFQAYETTQAVKAEMEEEKAKLLDHYERRLAEGHTENEKLKRDLVYYKQISEESSARINAVIESQSRSENKSILLERELEANQTNFRSVREHYESEFKRMQGEITRLSQTNINRDTEVQTLKRALLHSEERVLKLEFDNRELKAQVSGVQALWENTVRTQKTVHEPKALDFVESPPRPADIHRVQPEKIQSLLNELQASDMGELKSRDTESLAHFLAADRDKPEI